MDSAKCVLQSIVLATQQVRNATSQYSITRGVRQVRQHSLVRLESEFQTIIDASRAILEILDNPPLCRHYMLNDCLVDWLSNTEPEMCLDTLTGMERTLNIQVDHEVQVFSGLTSMKSTCEEYDINAAIVLFRTHKAHFHFLLTADVWNYEKEDPRKAMPSKIKEDCVRGHGQPQSAPTKNSAIEIQRKEIISLKLKKLIKLLDALDFSGKHRQTSSTRQSDTCMWLPATDAYRSWREGTDSFLWLQGKGVLGNVLNASVPDPKFIAAGAGKSVLASFVVNDLNNTVDDGELLAYVYCDFRMKRSTSAVEVMRSILAQLMARLCAVMANPEDLLDELLKESDSRADSFYSVKGLSRHLSKVAILCPRTPLVVVDALDECREVESLLDGLIMSSGDVRIFATTRPLQNIISIISPFPCITLDKMVNELSADILLHVTRELDSRRRLRTFGERLKEEIRSKLIAGANGMFRWVQCQIDTLEKCTSVSEIRKVLESLPEGLEETYRRILLAIDRRLSDAKLVRRALVWLVASQRPIRMRELLEGLAIDPMRQILDPRFALIKSADLLDVCRSLVIHHEETDIIALSHMSVKEYLVGELVYTKLPRYHIVLEDAHERLARLCMAYIAFCLDQMKECGDRSSILMRERDLRHTTSYVSRPLLRYVLSDGFSHLAHLGSGNAGILKDMERLQVVIRRYTLEWDRVRTLVPSIRCGIPWPTSEHDFMFYILIAFASDTLFSTFLCHTAFAPLEGTNPLVYAAHFGKTEHARILISRGGDVNRPGLGIDDIDTDSSDTDGTCADTSDGGHSGAGTENSDTDNTADRLVGPLEVAVESWHAEIIDLLLVEGSIVLEELLARVLTKQPDEYPLYIIKRLLQTAGFAEWAVPSWNNQLLLEVMVEGEGEDLEQSGVGDLAICVQRLIDVGCAQNPSGETILHIAAEKGCIHAVEHLLSTYDTLPLDIVSSALNGASSERVEIVRLLIKHGADVNPLAVNGDTPLHITIRSSNETECLRVTQILVEAGSDPCRPDADDRPPIHLAVTRGFSSVVEYLLSKGVPLPRRIVFTAMQAKFTQRDKMVRLLVRKGANIHDLDDGTLLQVAMSSVDESDSLKIAKIVVDAGYNPSACNLVRDEAPLHLTVINKYLLSSLSSEDILSALAYPSTRAQILAFILGKTDGTRSAEENKNKNTLQDISRRLTNNPDRCLRAAEVFISIQRNLSSWDYGAVLAALFDSAVIHGSFSTVKYLREQDVALPPGILLSALLYEAGSTDDVVKMVGLLAAAGADARVLGANGNNLLHVAASRLSTEEKCLEVTKTLVEAGCDPTLSNAEGKTPIQIAVTRGFVNIVEYLFSLDIRLHSSILFFVLECRDTVKREIILRMVRLLVAKGADVHAIAFNGDSLVHVAMRSFEEEECHDLTIIFAEAGSNLSALDARGEPPIRIALTQEFASVVWFLVLCDVTFPPDILFIVLQWQRWHTSPLVTYRNIIHALLRGAHTNVLQVAPNGDGLLHAAIRSHDQAECLMKTRLIIGAGCSASTLNADGKAPIQLAVNKEFFSVAEYLLLRGVALPRDILRTVFEDRHDSIRRVLRIVAFLIRMGADVHARAANGDTPLHVALAPQYQAPSYATRFFLLEIVKLLVGAGGDPHARNAVAQAPLDLAVVMEHHDIVRYLRHGAGKPRRPLAQTTVATGITY